MVPKLANDGSDRAIKNFFFVLFVLAVFLIGSCSWTAMQEKTMSPGRCLPFFPDQDGWYGGDAAYSIALDDQRTLWLFGDTFAACEAWRQDRVGMDVVLGTTVGISTCSKINSTLPITSSIKAENLFRRLATMNGFGRKIPSWSKGFYIFR